MHVDFVEGGQHGHGRLGLDQALGDLGAQTGHRHALLDPIASSEDRCLGSRRGSLGRCGSRSLLLGLHGGDHVFLGHPTTLAGAGDAVRIDAVLFGQLACRRGQDRLFRAGCGRRRALGSLSSRLGRWRGSRRRRYGTGLDYCDDLFGKHGVAFVLQYLAQHAVGRRHDLQHHLVGFDVDQQLVTLDCITRLLVPGGDGAVGNRFGESRGFDLDSHLSDSY